MTAFHKRCRDLMYSPNHHLNRLAVSAFGLWFGMSHVSGAEALPAFLLGCGDLMTKADELATTRCTLFGKTTTLCPCCHKEVSVKVLPEGDLDQVMAGVIDSWNRGEKDADFLRVAMLSLNPVSFLAQDVDHL